MALTQIRANIGGQWYTLSWSTTTRRYEAELILNGSSTWEPGGYYNVVVEATNETGSVVTADGDQFHGLRLVLRETTPPTVTLVSPAAGYATERPASILAEVADAGSGVNPDTLALLIDGAAVPFTVETVSGGYRMVHSSILEEGPHTLTVSGQDYDGNIGERRFPFTVDTVPPVLEAKETRGKLLVDEKRITITGSAFDEISGLASVTISCNGTTEAPVLFSGGAFVYPVPLAVGLNEITVTAQDAAGLKTSITIPVIRLITDRNEEDKLALDALLAKPIALWTTQEQADFSAGVYKGSYDFSDINRVVLAEQYLAEALRKAGYAIQLSASGGWSMDDAYSPLEAGRYLEDVAALRGAVIVLEGTPYPPFRLSASKVNATDGLTLEKANDIEKILVMTDSALALTRVPVWYSGEIFCGEV